ncbi:MAG TPA: hypothetical protein HPQ04_14300 [Rhodospirillaceae bacterium]|nr:hypothetical protein [Rhodospirillaceae bacterium]
MALNRPLAAALLLALLMQMVDLALGVPPLLDGGLFDADCYSRLTRVLQLHDGGIWWDRMDPRINAPYGETLQWTRPLDLLLELGAEPLGRLIGYRPALFAWGAVISPLLLAATLVMLWRGWRDHLGAGGFLLMAALMQLSPSLIAAFLPGRPDHHSLLALLFLGQLTLMRRTLDGGMRCSALNGFLGGLALWVSLEAAVPQALFGLTLVGWWLAGRLCSRQVAWFSLALAATASLAVLVELPPSQWLEPAYDRLSPAQAVPLALNAGLWLLVAAVDPAGRRRWAAALAAGVLLAAASLALFPKLAAGPFVDHGEIARAWLSGVSEWQPLWPRDRERAAAMFNELGPALVVLPWLATRRDAWSAFLLAGALLFSGLSLGAVRWASYAQGVMLLPWTGLVCHLWTREALPMRRLAAVSAIAVGFLLAMLCGPRPRADAAGEACPLPAAAASLDALAPSGQRRPIVMTYLYIGPELEWRSGVDLVGIPSANQATISDTQAVLGGAEEAPAREVLARRGVDYLLICPAGSLAGDYRRPDGRSLHQRLERGDVPDWLTPLALPAAAKGFRLFRVDPGRR